MTTQADIAAAVLAPDRPTPDGILNPDGTAARKRFDVYRNNVVASLSEALELAFPVIRKLVGDDFFRAMSAIYLRDHPPISPLMMFYGEAMPDFLRDFAPAASVPYLGDVARLELAVRHSYHAQDASPIAPEGLSTIAPDALAEVRFAFSPATALVPSQYPLCDIWQANTQGGTVGSAPQTALVTRPDLDPRVDPLTPGQAAVTAALIDGAALGDAVKQGGAAFDLAPLFGLLLERNALISTKHRKQEP